MNNIKRWWWRLTGGGTVRVPIGTLVLLTQVHLGDMHADSWFLRMGATPAPWEHEPYLHAWSEIHDLIRPYL